jgi:GNAT superfamily N-acetyltransferase
MTFRVADWSTETRIDGQVFENDVPIALFFANRVTSLVDHDSPNCGGKYLFIADFRVVERRRRIGIGRAMYQSLEEEARKRGIRAIWLQPQPGIEGFWQKMGFGHRPQVLGRPHEMEKNLV